MNYRSREKTSFLSSSKSLLILGMVITAFMSVNLVKAINDNQRIQDRIERLKALQTTQEEEKARLESERDYTQTALFIEEEARNRLNLKKDGEIVVSLPPERIPVLDQLNAEQQAQAEFQQLPNPSKWWHYFFHEGTAAELPAEQTATTTMNQVRTQDKLR